MGEGSRFMARDGRGNGGVTAAVVCALAWAGAVRAQPVESPGSTETAQVDSLASDDLSRIATIIPCSNTLDCNDNQACTADLCSNGVCLHLLIPDCLPCNAVYRCEPVELVFIMDTSGSMRDEAAALCTTIGQVVTEMGELGIEVRPFFYGITQTPGGEFGCLTDHVVGLFGGVVPGDSASCPFPNTLSAYESWGPATAIVAENFPWGAATTKMIVPISDEGPCDGSRPEGCADPGADRDSITNAITIALANGVIVSPIAGSGSDGCVLNLGTALANGTGGIAVESKNPKVDFSDALTSVILNRCSLDDRCDDEHACTTNDRCQGGACVGTPLEECQPCDTAATCDDNDFCTANLCIDDICQYIPHFDESLCCDPATGDTTPIDDGNPCTADACSANSGVVTHLPGSQGIVCDDGKNCTIQDVCDGNGRCRGIDIGEIECESDADCFGFTCEPTILHCECGDVPEVCLELAPGPGSLPNPGCYSADEDVFVDIHLSSGSHRIVGGQFLVVFDPTVLEAIDLIPGSFVDPDSPFALELLRAINQSGGTIFYAVGVDFSSIGTRGPALIARLRFRALQACSSDEICFGDQNPYHTLLSDNFGRLLTMTTCCTGEIQLHGLPPAMTCPGSFSTRALPGKLAAPVSWTAPTAGGGCDGPLAVSCTSVNSLGADVDYLIDSGGLAPTGTSTFECRAVDACGVESTCEWSVEVRPTNLVEVDMQLSPLMSAGPVRRCIEFEFYSNCIEEPFLLEQTFEFGQPFNLPGFSNNVLMEIPAGNYECVVARDPKHTLRRRISMSASADRYLATFTGDPQLGGHWLIGGNLDDNDVIDALDQALLEKQFQMTLSRHTPCGTQGIHADIDGNGIVDVNDLAFIHRNFLRTSDQNCCGNTAGSTAAVEETAPIGSPSDSIEPATVESSKLVPVRAHRPR